MISFLTRAEGGTPACDRAEISRALALLIRPGERHELRALPSGACRVIDGDDLASAVEAAAGLSDQQLYWSLNSIKPDATRASKKTVLRRVWFLIDVDTRRPGKDRNATDAEKTASSEVVSALVAFLTSLGWPEPIVTDSGNGWHLYYRVDLPNDPLSQQLLKAILARLGDQFDGPAATLDRAVHDAPRIARLPGSMTRKGPEEPDRPHRMARLAYEPDAIEVVTIEQLTALANPPVAAPEEAPPVNGATFTATATNDAGKDAYVRAAIQDECHKVATATTDRNIQLNVSAFKLGTMGHWAEMDEAAARDALQKAACQSGLDRDPGCGIEGIRKTIESGWTAGLAAPKPRPADPATNGHATVTYGGSAPLTRGLEDITSTDVDWLWEDRIALGFISIFAGRTSMGKSLVLCDLAARLSRGDPPAFSEKRRPPCRTLFISEDPQEQMLAPRLREAGTVLHDDQGRSYVRLMTFEAMAQFTLEDIAMLERAYVECHEPTLIIIDPPANFLGKTDEHKNAELRKVLMGVVGWMQEKNVALVLLSHLNKQVGKGLDAVERIMGSVAWATVARLTLAFDQDPEDPLQFVCGGTKNNLGPKAQVVTYQISQGDVSAKLTWGAKVETTMDDALNRVKKRPRALVAAEWLAQQFRDRRTWPSEDLYDLGKIAGVSHSAIWEAAQALKKNLRRSLITPQDGGKRYWEWAASPGWPPDSQEMQETSDQEENPSVSISNGPTTPF